MSAKPYSPTFPMPDLQKARLNSWKEIADYLDRDKRTVIRWEKEKGLPAHRVPGGKRHAVFAYTEEIDNWLSGSLSPAGRPLLSQTAPFENQRRGLFGRNFLSAKTVFLAMASLLFLVAISLVLRDSTIRLARISTADNKLVAWNETGKPQWVYQFVQHQDESVTLSQPSYIGDLDGDLSPEVLSAIYFSVLLPKKAVPQHELYCFSNLGKLLWHFQFQETLSFENGTYGPPWFPGELFIYGTPNRTRIAWVVRHQTWWPSVFLLLNNRGQLLGKFVNSGWIHTANLLESSVGRRLLLGGITNASNSGMMAVLDEDHISGSSPEQAGSPYECKTCPEGRPLRYFVFPRSELNLIAGDNPNNVLTIDLRSCEIEVRTYETPERESGGLRTGAVQGIYEFSPQLELKRASFSDAHKDAHRRLELEGKISHPWERCPERKGPTVVRSWEPQSGWIMLRPHYGKDE